MKKSSEQMRKVAEARWGNKFQMFAELSHYIQPGNTWNEVKKWKTTHVSTLLKMFKEIDKSK